MREKILEWGYKIVRIKAMTMHYEGKVTPMVRMRRKYHYRKTLDRCIGKHKGIVMRQIPFSDLVIIRIGNCS